VLYVWKKKRKRKGKSNYKEICYETVFSKDKILRKNSVHPPLDLKSEKR